MGPTFKAADRSDVDVLLGLRRAFCCHQHFPFAEGAARTALDNLLADDSLGKVWLIHLGGAAVGYIVLTFSYSLEFDGRDAFVDELYVEEGYRGRGVGGLRCAWPRTPAKRWAFGRCTSKWSAKTTRPEPFTRRLPSRIATTTF